MKKVLFFVVILLSSVTTALHAKEIKKNYHKVFDVNTSSVLHLNSGDGDVTITPWDKSKLDIAVEYHAEVTGSDPSCSSFEVQFEQQGNQIRVKEKESHTMRWGRVRIVKYTYEIKAPPYVALAMKGSDGDLSVSGWKSAIDCKLSDGSARLSNIQADVKVKISDGSLRIDRLTGNLRAIGSDGNMDISGVNGSHLSFVMSDGKLAIDRSQGNIEIRASDGKVTLRDVKAGRLEIKTSDGSIDASVAASGTPDWRFKSSDGDIRIRTGKDLSADYTIRSSDGAIRIEHPKNTTLEQRGHYARGRFGTGQGSISASSSDGDISLLAQ